MHRTLTVCGALALSLLAAPAIADVWKWVDPLGNTRFVDTKKPIYTWVDESGKVNFSDTPDHQNAIAVQLVWHSQGSLDDLQQGSGDSGSNELLPGESEADAEERRKAEAYYCKRATEIYESYLNAPDLYRTDDAGARVYLTQQEKDQTIAETKARVDELCP